MEVYFYALSFEDTPESRGKGSHIPFKVLFL